MGKNPAFQFYPSDWTRDLDDQDLETEGAWIRIVCRLWWSETRGEATKPLKEWARILRKTEQKTMKIFQILFGKGIASGSVLDNQNITIISRRMVRDCEISKIRREVGRLGGNPELKKTCENLVNQNLSKSAGLLLQSSTSNNKPPLPPKKRGDEYETDFLTFWNAYPKKAKKPNAYREWKKLGSKRPSIAALTACIQKQATWRPWIEGYIPDPERWLKNERWLDEPPPAGGNGNGKGIRTSRTDPRDPALQSREDAEVAAIIARREAAKQSARRDPRGDAKPNDAPDFSAIGPTG